jgi:hypothetical protein
MRMRIIWRNPRNSVILSTVIRRVKRAITMTGSSELSAVSPESFAAVGASPRPITITTDPITASGKRSLTHPFPIRYVRRAARRKKIPVAMYPERVALKPYAQIIMREGTI